MKRIVYRYFEQYKRELVPRKNGKGSKIVFRYIGDYYRLTIHDKEWIVLKWVFLVLFAVYIAVYEFLALRNTASNYELYISIPIILMVFPAYFLGYGVIANFFAKREMTLRSYRESIRRIYFGSLASLCLNGVIFILECLFANYSGNLDSLQLCGFGFCLLLMLCIFLLIFRAREFVLTPNTDGVPDQTAEEINDGG